MRILKTFFANYHNEGIFVTTLQNTSLDHSPYPIDGPMWYVRELMVIVLLAPAIYWMVKLVGKWFIIALGMVFYFYKAIFMPSDGIWWWISMLCTASFFFSWGAYYSITKENFVEKMRKYSYAPLLYIPIAIADTLTKKAEFNIYIHNAGIIVGVIYAIVLVSYLLEKDKVKVNTTLANCSFFVFAIHALILSDIGKIIFSILHLPDTPYAMLALYFIVPILTTTICVLLYVFLRRYMPSLCNLLTGGR